MKHKSSKPSNQSKGGSWLTGIGTLLLGIAAVCELIYKFVAHLLD